MDPDEIVVAFRRLGAVYRKAVMQLDAQTLRTFFLIRAEALIHLGEAQWLEVLAAEVVQQTREAEQLLSDLLAVTKRKRPRAPSMRLYRSNVAPESAAGGSHNVVELDP